MCRFISLNQIWEVFSDYSNVLGIPFSHCTPSGLFIGVPEALFTHTLADRYIFFLMAFIFVFSFVFLKIFKSLSHSVLQLYCYLKLLILDAFPLQCDFIFSKAY